MYDDDPDKKRRDREMSLFLRKTVPVLLKTPAPTTQTSASIKLTKEEQEAVNERMAEFYEHDR
jgi:hypothetical protein